MPNKIVKLEKPLVGHEAVRQLEFREPRWDDIMAIGDPYIWARSPRDPEYVEATPIPERVKTYAEKLIAEGDNPGDPLLLTQLGIQDTIKVRDTIISFFLSVDPKVTAGSTPSLTNSSSTSNGSPTSSGA